MNTANPTDVFLLPHQDDEYLIQFSILRAIEEQRTPLCIFITNGQKNGKEAALRDRESIAVLSRLGVQKKSIFFLRSVFEVNDMELIFHLESVCEILLNYLMAYDVKNIFTPAWEGGHPDHDACCALAFRITEALKNTRTMIFPAYNCAIFPYPFFIAGLSLVSNGPVKVNRISLLNSLKHTFNFFCYRSQLTTWIGLGPFFVIKYLFYRKESLQDIRQCKFSLPHGKNKLLYKSRWNVEFTDIKEKVDKFFRLY